MKTSWSRHSLRASVLRPQDEETASRVRKHPEGDSRLLAGRQRNALATAASPMHLTSFGQAALQTSLSPESVGRKIVEYLAGGRAD